MKGNTAMIIAILQAIIIFRHIILWTCRRFTTVNVDLYFLSKVWVFI